MFSLAGTPKKIANKSTYLLDLVGGLTPMKIISWDGDIRRTLGKITFMFQSLQSGIHYNKAYFSAVILALLDRYCTARVQDVRVLHSPEIIQTPDLSLYISR